MYFSDREYGFPRLINKLGLKTGIEIGVRRGNYSELLLENTDLSLLYSLDIFIHTQDLKITTNSLNKFGNRSIIMQGKSPEASSHFTDESLDFIYIDASHSYQAVKDDLIAWWPKLKSGGLFAGDDYTFVINPGEGEYGVVKAVDEFEKKHDLQVFVTSAGNKSIEERHRVARGMGKVIEYALNEIIDIKLGTTSNFDDIRIPNWYCIKP